MTFTNEFFGTFCSITAASASDAQAIYRDDGATLDDLREAVTTLEETERIARRVLGGAHPTTTGIEENLQDARAALRARETQPSGGSEVLQTADDLAAYFGGS